jgi:acetyltransferase-like isoleucine patch superfamily enzyme
MTDRPPVRWPYALVAWAAVRTRNVVRYRWRPFWLRRRLAWVRWGASGRARLGTRLGLGRRVRIHVLPGGTLLIGDRVRLQDGVILVVHPGATLEIGDGTYVGPHSELHARERVSVGPDCLLAGGVVVIDHNHVHDHRSPVREKETRSRPVEVGAGCWLATRAVVTAGARIGRYCTVGAGAVVTGEIPEGAVATGVPASCASITREDA